MALLNVLYYGGFECAAFGGRAPWPWKRKKASVSDLNVKNAFTWPHMEAPVHVSYALTTMNFT